MIVTIQSKTGKFKPYLLTGVVSINQFNNILQIVYINEKERPQNNSYDMNDNDLVITMSI